MHGISFASDLAWGGGWDDRVRSSMRVASGAPPDLAFGGENRRGQGRYRAVGRVHSGRASSRRLGTNKESPKARDQGHRK